jgi:hypothetical protein
MEFWLLKRRLRSIKDSVKVFHSSDSFHLPLVDLSRFLPSVVIRKHVLFLSFLCHPWYEGCSERTSLLTTIEV